MILQLVTVVNDLREAPRRCFVCAVHPVTDAVRVLVRRTPLYYAGQDMTRWVLVMAWEAVTLLNQIRSVSN
jgi:hypothetical protein